MGYYDYDAIGQSKRREKIKNELIKLYGDELKSDKLDLRFKKINGGVKEKLSLILPFLGEEEYATECQKLIEGDWTLDEFHTFISFLFMLALVQYDSTMTQELKDIAERFLRENAAINMLHAWDFMGINDNTPAMIMSSLILGGEYFGEESWVRCGSARLEQLNELLERREYLSEFNSPTYTPITICAVAAIAEYSKNYKEKAIIIEAKLWEQFLNHTYLPASNLAGPFERAYIADKLCTTNQARCLLYQILGDQLSITPFNTIFGKDADDEKWFYSHISTGWISSMTYHCPDALIKRLLHRSYPYCISGLAELSSSADKYLLTPIKGKAKGDYPIRKDNLMRDDLETAFDTDDCFEYPCVESKIDTYMTPSFSLGTCTREFHSGLQTDSFIVSYVKGKKQ